MFLTNNSVDVDYANKCTQGPTISSFSAFIKLKRQSCLFYSSKESKSAHLF